MAIVQISQITNRLGLNADLPNLAGGELGWSTDTRQLYIGNGPLSEGAPVIGNTEILTEFSDILNLAAAYTYQGTAAGYTVQTGPTVGTPVSQSIQTWMDQWASVKDFGAKGDGVTDDTAAINRALNQLYCQQVNPQIRRALFFPAGVYVVTSPINIPTYATLYGEGPTNSIIQSTPSAIYTGAINGFTLTIGTILVGSVQIGQVISGAGIIPGTTIIAGSGSTWTVITPGNVSQNVFSTTISVSADYVAQTADSLQQTGINIGTGTATPPTSITITNMAFQHLSNAQDVFLVQSATDCEFKGVSFIGGSIINDLENNILNTTCIAIGSTLSITTTDILFDGCRFSGASYGIGTTATTAGVTVTNSNFNNLYQGINLGGTPGPSGTRITNNIFDDIYAEGIVITSSLNATGYNIFYDVADSFGGVASPTASIILLEGQNNVSIGDMFERSAAYSITYPQVVLSSNTIATTNGSEISLGNLTVQSGLQAILADATPLATTAFTLDTTISVAYKIDYTITRYDGFRTGTLVVTSLSSLVVGNQVSYTDDYVENVDLGVTLTAFQDPNNPRYIAIQYTTGAPLVGYNAVMSYSSRYF